MNLYIVISLILLSFGLWAAGDKFYPGSVDEEKLKVQEELPKVYKQSRKQHETQLRRQIASELEEDEE